MTPRPERCSSSRTTKAGALRLSQVRPAGISPTSSAWSNTCVLSGSANRPSPDRAAGHLPRLFASSFFFFLFFLLLVFFLAIFFECLISWLDVIIVFFFRSVCFFCICCFRLKWFFECRFYRCTLARFDFDRERRPTLAGAPPRNGGRCLRRDSSSRTSSGDLVFGWSGTTTGHRMPKPRPTSGFGAGAKRLTLDAAGRNSGTGRPHAALHR